MNRLIRRIVGSTAAVLILAASGSAVSVAPASAGDVNFQGHRCDVYFAVEVCGWINFDSYHNRIRAGGTVTNHGLASGNPAWVAATVCFEGRDPRTGHSWVVMCGQRRLEANHVVATSQLGPGCSAAVEYRAVVLWAWDPMYVGNRVAGVFRSNWVSGSPWCL